MSIRIHTTPFQNESEGNILHCSEGECEGESSNHYHDFILAKELFRWLGRSTYSNDRRDHK